MMYKSNHTSAAAKRPKRAKIKPEEEAVYFSSLWKDKDGFDVKYINSFKGEFPKYMLTCLQHRHILIIFLNFITFPDSSSVLCQVEECSAFLVEYRGEVLTKHEHENRQRVYHDALKVFMFEFRFDGKQLWYVMNLLCLF